MPALTGMIKITVDNDGITNLPTFQCTKIIPDNRE